MILRGRGPIFYLNQDCFKIGNRTIRLGQDVEVLGSRAGCPAGLWIQTPVREIKTFPGLGVGIFVEAQVFNNYQTDSWSSSGVLQGPFYVRKGEVR